MKAATRTIFAVFLLTALSLPVVSQTLEAECEIIKLDKASVIKLYCITEAGESFYLNVERETWPAEWAAPGKRYFYYMESYAVDGEWHPIPTLPTPCDPPDSSLGDGSQPNVNGCDKRFMRKFKLRK